MARCLAPAGAQLTLNGRDEAALERAVAQSTAKGYQATGILCEITDADRLETAFSKVGAVDILVNNTGIQIRAPFLEHETDTWRRIFDNHVWEQLCRRARCCRA